MTGVKTGRKKKNNIHCNAAILRHKFVSKKRLIRWSKREVNGQRK